MTHVPVFFTLIQWLQIHGPT